jgi:hypothetical protein
MRTTATSAFGVYLSAGGMLWCQLDADNRNDGSLVLFFSISRCGKPLRVLAVCFGIPRRALRVHRYDCRSWLVDP